MKKDSHPFFSIIIPTFNREKTIGHAIDSVISQTVEDYEIIVVDDGSTDNTGHVIAAYQDSRIRYIKQERSGLPAKGRNTGIDRAQGEYIAFLDSDDWWYPEKLEVVANTIESNQKCDMVTHKMDIYLENEGRLKLKQRTKFKYIKFKNAFETILFNPNYIILSATVAKRSLIQELNGLCEEKDVVAMEDFDLWLRIARRTEDIFFVEEVLGGYRLWKDNISGRDMDYICRYEKLIRRHLKEYSDEDSHSLLLDKLVSYEKALTYMYMKEGRIKIIRELMKSIHSKYIIRNLKAMAYMLISIVTVK